MSTEQTPTPQRPFNPAFTVSDIRWGKPSADRAVILDGFHEEIGSLRMNPAQKEGEPGEIHLLDVNGKILAKSQTEEGIKQELFKWQNRKALAIAKNSRGKEQFFSIGKAQEATKGKTR